MNTKLAVILATSFVGGVAVAVGMKVGEYLVKYVESGKAKEHLSAVSGMVDRVSNNVTVALKEKASQFTNVTE